VGPLSLPDVLPISDRRSFGMDPRAVVDIVLCGDAKFKWWLKDGRTAGRTVAASVVRSAN
jgi:hypothetical protein